MQRTNSLRIVIVSFACAAGLAAQDSPQPWRTFGSNTSSADEVVAADQGGAPDVAQRPQYNDPPPPPSGNFAGVPASLTVQPGTFVTVHVDQWLSSDKNQTGDAFYATLVQPLIVDGVVVARRGATVMGRVTEARKAGRVEGTSRLGLQLTNLSLVDGQQVSIQSQVIDRNGSTSVGRDAAVVGGTTALGAAVGASAAGGVGAAIGAGAGAAASMIGVLLTRGRPTEVYPESMVTFRLDSAVAISTTHAAEAFHYADQQDYGTGNEPQPRVAQQRSPRVVGPMGPVYRPYPYPYYYDPFYYGGGGFSVFVGPRFYGGYGRRFRR